MCSEHIGNRGAPVLFLGKIWYPYTTMLFLFLNLVLFFAVVLLLLALSMVWPPDSPWAPFWATSSATARVMCTVAKVNEKTCIYDLGCGTGTAICIAAKEFGSPCVGIEIDPLRFFISWINIHIRYRVSKHARVLRANFFSIPLGNADVFFIYLIPNALKRLTPKFLKEVKAGALFVSYVYPLPVELFQQRLQLVKHYPTQRIFVYKMVR